MLSSTRILDLIADLPRGGLNGKVRAVARFEGQARWAGDRTMAAGPSAKQDAFLREMYDRPEPKTMTYRHPGIDAMSRPRSSGRSGESSAPLTATELAWLQRLSADPAQVSYDDAVALASMAKDSGMPAADRRLVSAVWLPVAERHDLAAARVALANAEAAVPPPIPHVARAALAESISAETPGLTPDEASGRAAAAIQEAETKRHRAAATRVADAEAQLAAAQAAPARRTATTR